ncbi:cytochrome c3 family protein [Desulfosarcina ovata]
MDAAVVQKAAASWADSPYMDNIHAVADITCCNCHQAAPWEDYYVMNSTCENCHDLAKLQSAHEDANGEHQPNPHKSHLGNVDCIICHVSHGPSKVYCKQCHVNFDMVIPGNGVTP